MCRIFLSLFFISQILIAQEFDSDKLIRVVGDSLVGKSINGESIREVHGNVVITQDNVKITCNKAIQYLARNEAELIGKVVVVQDSITIKTDLGYYYGDTKVAYSKNGVDFFDGHVRLTSQIGYYYFDEKKAYFYKNVRLKDSATSLMADSLTHFDDLDKTIAVGRVSVKDSTSSVFADSLIHLRNEKITYGYRNVKVLDPVNRLAISGNYLENFRNKKYSKILGKPFLARIDTTNDGQLDTLLITSKMMESFGDSTKKLIATDSVRIVRGEFASINNFTTYFQDEQRLFTLKRDRELTQPVMWNGKSQLLGDTIHIFMKDNRLNKMEIYSNASIISQSDSNEFRYDQMSGKNIKMLFGENGLERSEVFGNVLSIYYLYDNYEPNGLLKSSSEKAIIYFDENEVQDVRLYGNPVSEYHPENLVEGKEKDFTLPTYIIIKNRPDKNEMIKKNINLINLLSENKDGG